MNRNGAKRATLEEYHTIGISINFHFIYFCSHLKELVYLDLTACIFAEFSLKSLVELPNLRTLILFNVWPLEHEFPTLCKLSQLQTLDLSVSKTNVDGNYLTPNVVSFIFIV